MEDIIQKIKDHPQFVFADSDDELISIIDDINPGLTQRQKFEIINDMKKLERSGSRKGSTVQQVVDAFEDIDNTSNDKLFQLAKDLPDGLGDEVIEALGVGLWRGDEPDEKEFFRIIESKFPRQGSRKGQDFTAEGIKNVANAFKDITTNKIPDAIGKIKEERDGSRKGTGPLCDLGSISGKGSRPENLGSIASKVSLGRNRSINMDGEYVEQESREGSRKGGNVTFKDVIDYFENLQETSPKDDDELWDEALNHFGVTTDLGKFDSSEFATYYYGSGIKSTNPIPDDMMV